MDRDGLVRHRYGRQRRAGPSGTATGPMRIRITNDRNIVTIETSLDGGHSWRRFGVQMDVSGYHHNVPGDFLSPRPALHPPGKGSATFRPFPYEPPPSTPPSARSLSPPPPPPPPPAAP